MTLLRAHLLTLVVAVSYLTLGLANPEAARELWAVYASVTFLLAVTALWCEWRIRGSAQ